MATKIGNTGVTFPDGTTQTTGAFNSVSYNSQISTATITSANIGQTIFVTQASNVSINPTGCNNGAIFHICAGQTGGSATITPTTGYIVSESYSGPSSYTTQGGDIVTLVWDGTYSNFIVREVYSATSSIKAYVRFNGISGASLAGYYNVSSVTESSTARYKLTYLANMPNSSYGVLITPAVDGTFGSSGAVKSGVVESTSTSNTVFGIGQVASGTPAESGIITVVVLG